MLAAGSEDGGLAARWAGWPVPAAAGLLLGALVFRFPRSVGLPALAAACGGLWWASEQLSPFTPVTGALPAVVVQPMTDRDLVTVFQKRVDRLELPPWPLVSPVYYRIRDGEGVPTEPWWAGAEALGWARSSGAPIPEPALRFGLYRLDLSRDPPAWRPLHPVLEGSEP